MQTSNSWKRLLYTVYSPFYDTVVKLLSPRRARSIELLDIKPGQKVLIVGAGTGLDLPFLPAHAHYTAIDLTPAMLARLEAKGKSFNLPIEARVMDAHVLDFENTTFDKAILHFIVAVIPDPHKCMQEVERVLKPGGQAVIYDKFLADTTKATWCRKALNGITAPLATDINRQIGEILSRTNLKVIKEEAANLGGLFKIVLVQKP